MFFFSKSVRISILDLLETSERPEKNSRIKAYLGSEVEL